MRPTLIYVALKTRPNRSYMAVYRPFDVQSQDSHWIRSVEIQHRGKF